MALHIENPMETCGYPRNKKETSMTHQLTTAKSAVLHVLAEQRIIQPHHPITIFQMTKHKPKNKTGAVQTRLGQDYPTFSAAAKKAGMSRDKLARIILKDYAAKIMSGEIVVESEPRIVKP
jgi:hypothetical protein